MLAVTAAAPAADAHTVAHTYPDRAEWRAKAPMPESRSEVAVAALEGRVYVVGGGVRRPGEPPVSATTLVTSYDPRTDRWSQHAPLPRPLSHVGMTAHRGKLYAFGGFAGSIHLDPQQAAYVYDPHGDSWRQLPDMPYKLGSVSVAAANGKLHLIGGRDARTVEQVPGTQPPRFQGFGTVRTHLVYDPVLRSWSEAAPLPVQGRDHAGVAVVGHRIHVFGGRVTTELTNVARHDVYDTRTHRWTTAAPLPTPRSAAAAVVLHGRIVYAGGECKGDAMTTPNGTYDDVTAYNPRTDRWEMLTSMPQGRQAFGAARVGDRAYFVGGALVCGGGASAETLELDLR